MRLRILSDLHLEFSPYGDDLAPCPQADVVVLAGDIHNGALGVQWAAKRFADQPVIYVPGNHEFYGQHSIARALEAMRKAAEDTNVHVLDDDAVVIDGVRFLGATLWTDFNLFGAHEASIRARREAMLFLRDLSVIGRFNLREWAERHARSRMFLHEQLALGHHGSTVVVTHHAPHMGSVHPMYAEDAMTPAFVSHLPALVGKADLWIHGHVHNSFFYEPYDCPGMHVACNPRGYAPRDKPWQNENRDFDPHWVLEV